MDRWINDFVILPDGSIAVSVVDRSLPPQRAVYLLDSTGAEQWRTLLGDEEHVIMNRALASARGAAAPDFYAATGFKTAARVAPDGAVRWVASLFELIGLTFQLAMAAHPAGGIVLGGYSAPPGDPYSCNDGIIIGVGSDGQLLWHWRCAEVGHCFPTTIVITADGTTIVHLTNRDPQALGSAGDMCDDAAEPQWIAWFDPTGRLSRLVEWPDDRRAEAMALDRQGRPVFYGYSLPAGRSFFRVLDARLGTLLLDRVFDDSVLGQVRRMELGVELRRLDVTNLGVSVVIVPVSQKETSGPQGVVVATLTGDQRILLDAVSGRMGYRSEIYPDGRGLLTAVGPSLIYVPLETA